ncbi:IS110 family transposase [Wolbachia endosymbiont of Listronotus oregonensis]|uniref:IS110 family transposase n=2 Tax=Wolbachia TaxID=953 RepID=UPI00209D19E7|nr:MULTISPECIES: IS110 family transposase [Rickettsiales]WMT84444.1 IS110 family transposase [Wolbachia endosymbiont of Listronotus oregonensis]WMT84739.1 IS110 family transposase [Wolbachia endosymbiont of Listronotus oregonensis]
MNLSNIIAGIDVSKNKLDIHIHPLGHYKVFENNVQAIDQILDFLHLHNVIKVGLEATGGYEKLCAYTLLSHGFEVYVIQPRWVRDYAKSLGIATKTDKIDCSIISRYINNTDMRVTPLKVSNVDFLRQKLSRRNQLVEMAKIQKTQAHQVTDISIIKQMEELLVILQNQIQVLEDEMIELIEQSQELKKKYISITSIPGVSKITAITIICYLPELGTLQRKQISSIAGVAPFNRDSGFNKGKRCIQGGRSQIRTVLYMCILSARKWNSFIKTFFDRLHNQYKKPYKVASTAAMRKLLLLANSLVRDDRVFTEEYSPKSA